MKVRLFTMEKFIIVPKEDKAVTMTIRIDRTLQEKYNEHLQIVHLRS